jgi:phytoene/squalene synthetase
LTLCYRKNDYENYLCIPFYPKEVRNAQYAIRAFNIELASIRESVSNPTIGKLRTQFWKDTIDKTFAVSCRDGYQCQKELLNKMSIVTEQSAQTTYRTGAGRRIAACIPFSHVV